MLSAKEIALAQKISRVAVWKIKKKYEQWGDDGLKDHHPGRLFEPLNSKFYDFVMQKISLGVKPRPLGRNFCMLKMRS